MHLLQHYISALARAFILSHRIIIGRILHHAHQCRGLLYLKILGLLAEIDECGTLDANSIIQEVKLIEIHLYYLLLGIEAFKLDSDHPLYRFLHRTGKQSRTFRRIQLLGELLGKRRSASCILVAHKHSLEKHTTKTSHIYTGMLLKAHILSGNKRIYDMLRHFIKIGIHAVACSDKISADLFAVGRIEH